LFLSSDYDASDVAHGGWARGQRGYRIVIPGVAWQCTKELKGLEGGSMICRLVH